jgi:hypothetical protein
MNGTENVLKYASTEISSDTAARITGSGLYFLIFLRS